MAANVWQFLGRFKRKKQAKLLTPEILHSLMELTVQNNAMCRQILTKHYHLEKAFNMVPDGPINLDSFFQIHPGHSDLVREAAENEILSNEIWNRHFPNIKNPFEDGH